MTIPRLELLSAVIAVKMDSLLHRELKLEIKESVFWTDSMIVLHYIKSITKRFQTFVANRVAVVHDESEPSQWKYIESLSNPADDASRGLNAKEMLHNERWKLGPNFLWHDETHWPTLPEGLPKVLDTELEVKKEVKSYTTTANQENIIDQFFRRYSCWYRLRKAVAWLIRFGNWLLKGKPKSVRSLDVEELQSAEKAILIYLQRRHYANEVHHLKSNENGCISSRSPIYNLKPFKDKDGLLKVKGRLQNADILNTAKHPIILPRDTHVTELIERYVHEWESKHLGREYVLSKIRQKYWIPRCRPLLNKVLQNCVLCKRLRGKLQCQRMANLPMDRVTPDKPPFNYCGVDCFGPFLVKRGRGHEKRYGCLFTCLTIRAIHIEKLHTMDGDSFINALIRFISRRGVPAKIRSDNGTNFIRGNKELENSIQEWNQHHKTKDRSIWERQIRTVRKVLNAILQNQILDDERLDTIFCQVEQVINSRPLCPVSEDPKDLKTLTPNDLLLVGEGFSASPGQFTKEGTYGRRWRHVQFMVDQFWKRCVREYLPTLQLRQKWIEPKTNIQIGDIVLVMDERLPKK